MLDASEDPALPASVQPNLITARAQHLREPVAPFLGQVVDGKVGGERIAAPAQRGRSPPLAPDGRGPDCHRGDPGEQDRPDDGEVEWRIEQPAAPWLGCGHDIRDAGRDQQSDAEPRVAEQAKGALYSPSTIQPAGSVQALITAS